MWASLHISGGPLKGRCQGKDSYRLLTCSVGHQGISYYRLVPSIQLGQASIFQEAPRRVAIMVKACIGGWHDRAVIRVYSIIGWLWASNMGEPSSLRRPLEGSTSGWRPYKLLTCSGGYQGISHYRLTPSIQYRRASIFQEAPRSVAFSVKICISDWHARAAIRVYPIIGWVWASNVGQPPSLRRHL